MDHQSAVGTVPETAAGVTGIGPDKKEHLSVALLECTKVEPVELPSVPGDDVGCSSMSSSTTECSEGRLPGMALVLGSNDALIGVGHSDIMRRGPGRPRKEDAEPVQRKVHPRRPRGKKSQQDKQLSFTGLSEMGDSRDDLPRTSELPEAAGHAGHDRGPVMGENVALPMAEMSHFEVSSATLSSVVSDIKQEPFEMAAAADPDDSCSRTSPGMLLEEPVAVEGTSVRPVMSLMEADAYSYHSKSGVMDKVCALCSRGEKSLLGQGELNRYEPTANFNPFKRQFTRAGGKRALSDTDETFSRRGQQPLTWRRTRGPLKQQSLNADKVKTTPPRRSSSQPALDFDGRPLPTVDELSLVGYSEDVDIAQLFEKTGHVWAHHCCAAWSEGVIQTEDYNLHYVDKAVFAGLAQKCSYCSCYGATINCRYARCSKNYHYPCASGSGCFQDIKTLSLLCPDHTDEAVAIANQEAYCVVCDLPGNISDQLFCTSCGQHYHGNCLDPAVEVNPVVRAGWQCPECKICQTCRQPGDDNKMLVCDTCDKGYHTFCLMPVMTTIPKNGWKCKNCRVCGDCGSRTPGNGPSSRWHLNYSVCDSCYQQRNKGLCCPLCGKAYRHFTQTKMLLCSQCKRHVHAECDESIESFRTKPEEYVCLACKNHRDPAIFEASSLTDSLPSVVDDTGLQDIENFGIFKGLKDDVDELMQSSQDSLVMTEDSISSMDIDLNALEKGVQQLSSVASPGPLDTNVDEVMPSVDLSSGTDTKGASPSLMSDMRPARPAGPGIGKPLFDDDGGKKGGTGRQRSRSAGVGKKKRPSSYSADRKRATKTKLRPSTTLGYQGCSSQDQNGKDDDHTATTVLCSARDQFTLKQDMCLSCGSYGVGEEGKLIACVQCGQCYHPYCVNIKISKTMLKKGWRCLDCTVCEGCGKPHDESRLILCDECDISFHIYCLDPPLADVPKGAWKCKWCIVCVTCGATTPGIEGCQWQNNYSQCAKCASLEICPACNIFYAEGELIVQCSHCERWLHGYCDKITNEDEAELAVDYGYHCLLCRPITGALGPFPPVVEKPASPVAPALPPPPVVLPPPVYKEPELHKVPKTFFLDGICLSETGLSQIRNLSLKFAEKKQRPRWRRNPSLTHPALRQLMLEKLEDDAENADAKPSLEAIDGEDVKPEAGAVHEEWDITSPPVDRAADGAVALTPVEKKKKQRIRIGTGIGGFMPRHRTRGGCQVRGGRFGAGMTRASFSGGETDTQILTAGLDQDDDMRMMDGDSKKMKPRRQRKVVKKSHMEDSYPAYLQDAFFGRDLLDKCKDNKVDELDLESDDDKEQVAVAGRMASTSSENCFLSGAVAAEMMETPEVIAGHPQGVYDSGEISRRIEDGIWSAKAPPAGNDLGLPTGEDSDREQHIDDADLDVLPTEALDEEDIMNMNLPWEDIAHPSSGEPTDLHEHLGDDANSRLQDGLEAMLNPMDELAQIDNETLEVILKSGLSSDVHTSETSPTLPGGSFSLGHLPGQRHPAVCHTDDGLFPTQDTPSSSISPFSPSLAPEDFPSGVLWPANAGPHFGAAPFHDMHIGPTSSSMMGLTDDGDAVESLSYNQRNIKKWEIDEPLGEMATISPVLYCNLCHPDLKVQYPEWSERAKQITKLWRKVPSDQRAPYLAKARDNRATHRMHKAQKIGQEMKRRPKDQSSSGVSALASQPTAVNPSTPDLNRQASVDQSESSNHSSAHTANEERDIKMEPDACTFIPHAPQTPPTQSSPSCGSYVQQHRFKQPRPPLMQSNSVPYDPYHLPPGTPRPSPEGYAGHPQSLVPSSGAPEQYGQLAGPSQPVPDQFLHQQNVRAQAAGPRPAGLEMGRGTIRQFAVPFPAPGPGSGVNRFGDPFGAPGSHPVRQPADHFINVSGAEHYPHPPEGSFVHYSLPPQGSEHYPRPQMNMREMYATNSAMHPDTYARIHAGARSSTSDPYAHASMIPSSDPHIRPPLTPRGMMPDHYSVQPATPRPLNADHFVRSPMTPGPSDPYARPPMTPRPQSSDQFAQSPAQSDNYTRPPLTPGSSEPRTHSLAPSPSDPYMRPPMTPRPSSSDSFAHPGSSSEAYGPPGNIAGRPPESPDIQRQGARASYVAETAAAAASSPSMDDEQQGRQQQPDVRELLAKHTKQRQSKKKQEETRQQEQQLVASGSQLPLRHWPDDGSVPPAQTKQVYLPHEAGPRSTLTEFSGTPGAIFSPRDMDAAVRQQSYPGQLRPPGSGDMELFGPRGVLPPGDMVRQTFIGPMRGMRPGGGMAPQGMHPSHMAPGHFLQHRQMAPYGDVRPEMFPDQIVQNQGMNRPQGPGQEGMMQAGFHPRMLTSHRPQGSPRAVGSYENLMLPGAAMSPQQQQHQMMIQGIQGQWLPEFYRPGMSVSGGSMQPRMMYVRGPAGSVHMPPHVVNIPGAGGMPSISGPAGSRSGPGQLMNVAGGGGGQRGSVDDIGDKSDGDQFEDLIGAGENFNILEYTDPELDNALADQHDKSIFDEHLGLHPSLTSVPPSAPSQTSASASSLTSTPALPGSQPSSSAQPASHDKPSGLELPAGSVAGSSVPASKQPELSGKPATTSGVVPDDQMRPEGTQRVTESSAKSTIASTGFMTTDFQAKFLEFSQRKVAAVGAQSVANDETDTAAGSAVAKGKKVEVSSKKSSPPSVEEAHEVKPNDAKPSETSAAETKPETDAGSALMQVDGCCDDFLDSSSSDDEDDMDMRCHDAVSDVSTGCNVANSLTAFTAQEYVVMDVNEDDEELVHIWQSSIGLQVDGAADDDMEKEKESHQNSSDAVSSQTVDTSGVAVTAPSEDVASSSAASVVDSDTPEASVAVAASKPCISTASSSSVSVSSSQTAFTLSDGEAASATDLTIGKTEPILVNSVHSEKVHEASQSRPLADHDEMPSSAPSASSLVPEAGESPQVDDVIDRNQSDVSVIDAAAAAEKAAAVSSAYSMEMSDQVSAHVTSVPTGAIETQPVAPPVVNASQSSESAPPATASLRSDLIETSSSDVHDSREPPAVSRSSSVQESLSENSEVRTAPVAGPALVQTIKIENPFSSEAFTRPPATANVIGISVSGSTPVAAPATDAQAVIGATPSSTGMTVPLASAGDASTLPDPSSNTPVSVNGMMQVKTEPSHVPLQLYHGHPPPRHLMIPSSEMIARHQFYLPVSDGMMPSSQMPHGPPPPYHPKQYVGGPQTFMVRHQHPSLSGEAVRHPVEFIHAQPGAQDWMQHPAVSREWSGHPQPQHEWMYSAQSPAPSAHHWTRAPFPGYGSGTSDVPPAQMFMHVSRNTAHSPVASGGFDGEAMQQELKIKRPSQSPILSSPGSARSDHPNLASPSPHSRSRTPHNASQPATPQACFQSASALGTQSVDGTSSVPGTPVPGTPVSFSLAVSEPLLTSESGTVSTDSTPVTGSTTTTTSSPSSSSQVFRQSSQPPSADSEAEQSAAAQQSASVTEQPTTQPSGTSDVGSMQTGEAHPPPYSYPMFSSADSVAYGMRASHPDMALHRMPSGRYIMQSGPYLPGHPSAGMTGPPPGMFRLPSSSSSNAHSTIGALLNPRPPSMMPQGMHVHYGPRPGIGPADARYLMPSQDPYAGTPVSARHPFTSPPGARVMSPGGALMSPHPRGVPPSMSPSAGSPDTGAQQSPVPVSLPNNMQSPPALRGPFRLPNNQPRQCMVPGPMSMRPSQAPSMTYGPRPMPSRMMMMPADPQQQLSRMSGPGFADHGPSPQARQPNEQPLLLQDLLEQEKQEQRRQAEQHQQPPSTPVSDSSAVPVTTSSCSTSAAAASIPSGADTSAILTDADVDKVNVDVMSPDIQKRLMMGTGLPDDAQLQHQHQAAYEQMFHRMPVEHQWMPRDMAPGYLPPRQPAPSSQLNAFVPPGATPYANRFSAPVPPVPGGPLMEASPLAYTPPPKPPDPPTGEPQSEEEQQVRLKYEEWLQQNDVFLTTHVQLLEAQVAKYRRAKKALNAKQRGARKNGSELTESDAQALVTTCHEQSCLQKQLDLYRKQSRTHRSLIHEYQSKQPFQMQWPPSAELYPGAGPMLSQPLNAPTAMPSKPSSNVTSGARAPGGMPPVRLPPAARQEYEAYIQSRVREMNQQGTGGIGAPVPAPIQPPLHTTIATADDNNPFSESFQQRERMEKLQKQEQQRVQMHRHLEQQSHEMADRSSIAAAGMFFDEHGQPLQRPHPAIPPELMPRYPGPQIPGQRIVYHDDGQLHSFPPQQPSSEVGNAALTHPGLVHSSPARHGSLGPQQPSTPGVSANMTEQLMSRVPTSAAAAAPAGSGGLQQVQQGDGTSQPFSGSSASPVGSTVTTPTGSHPSPHIASSTAAACPKLHLPSGTSPSASPSKFSHGLQSADILSSPSTSANIGNLMTESGVPEHLAAQSPFKLGGEKPKKKRRRRTKAEIAEDVMAAEACGRKMGDSGCVDLDLNASMFLSQFPADRALAPAGSAVPSRPQSETMVRFAAVPQGDKMAGGYRPPSVSGPQQRPGLLTHRPGLYHMKPDGRDPADLQTFVNRMQSPHFFPGDGQPGIVPPGQRFPSGQPRAPYSNMEQSYVIPPEIGMKGDPRNELAEQSGFLPDAEHGEDGEDAEAKMMSQNIILKKLLNTTKQGEQQQQPSVSSSSHSQNPLSEDEESVGHLTPEQQRQLRLIENMPFMIEKEQDEMDLKELQRQVYERRRKELADQQPKVNKPRQRRSVKDGGMTGPPDGLERVPKKRPKRPQTSGVPVNNVPGAMVGIAGKPVPERVSSAVDYAAMAEQLLQQLQQLPPVTLQEPEVRINYAVWPMLGTSVFSDGSANSTTALKGGYGWASIDDVMDYYCSPPFANRSASDSSNATCDNRPLADVTSRCNLSADNLQNKAAGEVDVKVSQAQQQRQIASPGLSLVTSILNDQQARPGGAIADHSIRLPSPPLIEPRYEALSRASDQSPLTILSSSSPELDADAPVTDIKTPWLQLIPPDMKREENCMSPQIPVICPMPVKANKPLGFDIRHPVIEKTKCKEFSFDMDGQGFKPHMPGGPGKDQNQVSVVLTLSASAADNIGNVIAAIADLLRIAVPPTYEISRSPSPPPYSGASTAADLYRLGFSSTAKHKEEAINIQFLMQSRPKCCQNCNTVIERTIKVKTEVFSPTGENQAGSDDDAEDNLFCSANCRKHYDEVRQRGSAVAETDMSAVNKDANDTGAAAAVLAKDSGRGVEIADVSSLQRKSLKMSICIGPQQQPIAILPESPPVSKVEKLVTPEKAPKHKVEADKEKLAIKRLKENRYRRWGCSMVRTEKLIRAATEKELGEMMDRLTAVIRPKARVADNRKCVLCHACGDAPTEGPGRLLNFDAEKWVHLNCALWSNEVYETISGALMHVDVACRRGASTDCVHCKQSGATVGCFRPRCMNVYHVACAQLDNVTFCEDKSLFCTLHSPKLNDPMNILTSIAVFRRVYINRDENQQVARLLRTEDKKCVVRIGGLIIHNVGQLLPYQIQSGCFNTQDFIYPVGFKSTRYYWSYRQINKRCRYICKIEDCNGRPQFIITVLERGAEQIILRESSCQELARHILEPLEKMRRENDLVKIFPQYLTGDELFGLTDPTVQKIIESLPGVEALSNYHFHYGRSSLYKLPLAVNPTGCARSEPRLRTHFKKPHTLHGGGNCRSLPSTVTVMPGDVNSPYLKQFVHSKSQQYRRLKTEWRNNVYLRRSNVQGLGLFAARDLEKHTMVIEYIGQLIRNEVAEKREKIYEKQNHGVYMFRISDNQVVDATMAGGPARYINHSCHPNCVAEVVPLEKDSKIIIITKRKIAQGEELAYDYKFDFEDDQHKIPCLCGAPNCRKWMN